MNTILKITALLLLIFFMSCNNKPYTIEDSGKTVNLSTYDHFEVSLRANGSTGYQWTILPFDTTVFVQEGEPVFQADSDRVGAGGLQTFRFKTTGQGSSVLKMVYKKRWEEISDNDRTFELKIVCGTMGQILE